MEFYHHRVIEGLNIKSVNFLVRGVTCTAVICLLSGFEAFQVVQYELRNEQSEISDRAIVKGKHIRTQLGNIFVFNLLPVKFILIPVSRVRTRARSYTTEI